MNHLKIGLLLIAFIVFSQAAFGYYYPYTRAPGAYYECYYGCYGHYGYYDYFYDFPGLEHVLSYNSRSYTQYDPYAFYPYYAQRPARIVRAGYALPYYITPSAVYYS